MERFGLERTKDRKVQATVTVTVTGFISLSDLQGVTIPSQRRYVRYYDILLRSNLDPRDLPLPGQVRDLSTS